VINEATLRVARPTDQLDAVVRFYTQGLGLSILESFRDHDGFDGTMLGRPGGAYHLEFVGPGARLERQEARGDLRCLRDLPTPRPRTRPPAVG
jgi:hypothetical protein